MKQKDFKPIKNTKINDVDMLKDSNLSAKKLMTHTQASAKTTRYNNRVSIFRVFFLCYLPVCLKSITLIIIVLF